MNKIELQTRPGASSFIVSPKPHETIKQAIKLAAYDKPNLQFTDPAFDSALSAAEISEICDNSKGADILELIARRVFVIKKGRYFTKNHRSAVKVSLYTFLNENFLYQGVQSYWVAAAHRVNEKVNDLKLQIDNFNGVYLTGKDQDSCFVVCNYANLEEILANTKNLTEGDSPIIWEINFPEKDGITSIYSEGSNLAFPYFE